MSGAQPRIGLARDAGPALAIIASLVAAWEVACRLLTIPVWLLPAPSVILRESWAWRDVLPRHLWATALEVLGGFAGAVLLGMPLAVLMVQSPLLRRVVYPILLAFQSAPKVALAPLLLIWIGYGKMSALVIAAIVAFFPIVVNTITGFESVAPELLDLARSWRTREIRVFWKVRFPWALPHVFAGMKVGVTLAVVGAVVGEFVGSDQGLGFLVVTASSTMNTAAVFGMVAVLGLLGIASFGLVCLVERLLCPWYLPLPGVAA